MGLGWEIDDQKFQAGQNYLAGHPSQDGQLSRWPVARRNSYRDGQGCQDGPLPRWLVAKMVGDQDGQKFQLGQLDPAGCQQKF